MYSSFIIIGTLIAKPTSVTTQSGIEIATAVIQLKDKGRSIIEVKGFKDTATEMLKLNKGQIVIASGVIRSREWTNKQGKTSHILELMAFKVQVLEDKKNVDDDYIPF